MKTFLLVILIALPAFAFSQNADNTYQYCVVRVSNILLTRKYNAEVDYGQSRKLMDESNPIKDDNGNAITFNSIAHVLNYMADKGWKVIQVFGAGYESSTPSDYRYLMEAKKSNKTDQESNN